MIIQIWEKLSINIFLKGVGGMSIHTTIGMFYISIQINSQIKHKNTLNHLHYYSYQPNMTLEPTPLDETNAKGRISICW